MARSDAANASRVQRDLLLSLLESNEDITFFRQRGVNATEITDEESFKKSVPLTTYEDYEPYINVIIDTPGDTSGILTAQPLAQLAVTSGTSGSTKKLPSTSLQVI